MTTILHITWGLEAGGKERFLYRLARGLNPERFKSTVLALRAKGPFYEKLLDEGHNVRFLDKRPGLDLRAIRALRREIRSLHPDIIHAQDFTSAFAALAAIGFRRAPPLVMTLHGGHMDLSWPKKKLHQQFMKRAAAVTVVSKQMAGEIRDRLGESIAVKQIPLGIDTDAFTVSASVAEPRSELGLPPEGPLVVGVMRLEEPKDPQLVVRAAAQVVQHRPDCRFLIVGEGALRPELLSLIHKLGLKNNVFLPGYRTDIPDILAMADLCVLPSKREGMPLSILEYMAAGKPVVATRVGGIGELVQDGATGYLVEPGDDAALADRIRSLLESPGTATDFGRNGRAFVLSRFSEAAMIAAYETLYEEMVLPSS